MPPMHIITFIVALLVSSAPYRTGAEELTTFKCSYGRVADGEELAATKEPFSLIFVADKKGDATLVGNNGSSKVTGVWQKNGQGVTFIEITESGNVMTTAIDAANKSAHSRSTILGGHVIPSQYYGECRVQ